MARTLHDQTLALAGIFQAASLVSQLANRGTANSAVIDSSIESLFRFDAPSVEAVFGNLAGVAHGLQVLRDQLGGDRQLRDMEITRYVIGMITLEKKLRGKPVMLNEIRQRLEAIERQLDVYDMGNQTLYHKLGELYKDTISTLGPRIIVSGERPYLSNENLASKVRALLLAGIRAAVLWRQCGGNRWQFLLRRRAIFDTSEQLLREMGND